MSTFPEDQEIPELPDYVKKQIAKEKAQLATKKKKQTKKLQKALQKLVPKKDAKAITFFLLEPQAEIAEIKRLQSNYCVSVFTSLSDVSESSTEAKNQMDLQMRFILDLKRRLDDIENIDEIGR